MLFRSRPGRVDRSSTAPAPSCGLAPYPVPPGFAEAVNEQEPAEPLLQGPGRAGILDEGTAEPEDTGQDEDRLSQFEGV